MRLAKALGMKDDLARFSKDHPSVVAESRPLDSKKTDVVFLFEDGTISGKHELKLPIPIPIPSAPGLTSVAIPMFTPSKQPIAPYVIVAGNKDLGQSNPICVLDALAAKAYEEAFPSMITRQVVRATIKGAASSVAAHAVGKSSKDTGLGALTGFAVGALGAVSEIADTRSWRSLPQNVQVARFEVPPGEVLQLRHVSSDTSGSITVPAEAGKRFLVLVSRVGGKLLVRSGIL